MKDWLMCTTVVILFGFVAFLVWGLGQTLQSLFD
jgi:hypothetical protein